MADPNRLREAAERAALEAYKSSHPGSPPAPVASVPDEAAPWAWFALDATAWAALAAQIGDPAGARIGRHLASYGEQNPGRAIAGPFLFGFPPPEATLVRAIVPAGAERMAAGTREGEPDER